MGEWADIEGMGNLQVHQVIFGDQAGADFVGQAHVAHDPIGSFERLGGMLGGIPGKPCAAVRNFGGIDFKDLAFAAVHESEARAHLQK